MLQSHPIPLNHKIYFLFIIILVRCSDFRKFNLYISSSANRTQKRNKNHVHSLQPGVRVYARAHTHTDTLTTLPTCLSIRFYHHRDTVDSSFVLPEKIGTLRSQNHRIHCEPLKAARLHLCVPLLQPHTEKRSRSRNPGGTKMPACSFQHVRICVLVSPRICSYILMSLALHELLHTFRSAGIVFQKEKEVKY